MRAGHAGGDGRPPTLKMLVALAWPVIISRATDAVMGFVDALMTAPLGEDALAATTAGATNAFTLAIFPMGVAFIVQSFAAQLGGRGDRAAARRYAWYGLAVAALAGVLAIAAIPLVGPALGLFEYSPSVHGLMTDYMVWRLVGLGAAVGAQALGDWFGGLGDTRPALRASLLALVANVFFNWVLIYGELGAPALGVAGAALSTSIGHFLGFGYLLLRFARADREPASSGLRAAELWRMLRFGLPNGVNWFLEVSAFTVFLNLLVARMGTSVLAALNVVVQLNMMSFMPALAFASAGAILVGQALGRGDIARVRAVVRLTLRVNLLWHGAVALLYLMAPSILIEPFAQSGPDGARLVALGSTLLAVSAGWQVFEAIASAYGEALRAAGDTAWCMWVRCALAWLGFLPLSALVLYALDLGPTAMILCLLVRVAALAVVLVLRFRSGRWQHIDLTGSRSAAA